MPDLSSNLRFRTPTVGFHVFVLVCLALLIVGPPAQAELGGDCKLLNPGFGNPGLGCNGVGDACSINGKAGICTNMKRRISSLIYCVCSPDGKEVPEEVEAKATARVALAAECGTTATFDIDTSSPHIVDIAFAKGDGGQVVRLESFTGSFSVTTAPSSDSSRCQISIDSGEFTAPSFVLPDGRASGISVYTFDADSASSGVLDLSTGKYIASARGRISNALVSDLETIGTYRGTVDFAAGTITIDSTTLDLVDASFFPDVEPVNPGVEGVH